MNQRQVVIALTGGELVYFEMDPVIEKQQLLIMTKKNFVLNFLALCSLAAEIKLRDVNSAQTKKLFSYIVHSQQNTMIQIFEHT